MKTNVIKFRSMIAGLITLMIIFNFFAINAYASGYSQNPSGWAISAVKFVLYNELSDQSYITDYNRPVKRQDFAMMAVRLYQKAKGAALKTPVQYDFNDISTAQYKYEIQEAKNLGLVAGKGHNQFDPEGLITRQEICVMLFGLLKAVNPSADYSAQGYSSFADGNQIAGWARNAVEYVYKNNIMAGVGGSRIAPLENTTREMAMALFHTLSIRKGYIPELPEDLNSAINLQEKAVDVSSGQEFYNAIKEAVQNHKEDLRIKAGTYSAADYDASTALDKITNELTGLNFTVSGYKLRITSADSGSSALIYLTLSYSDYNIERLTQTQGEGSNNEVSLQNGGISGESTVVRTRDDLYGILKTQLSSFADSQDIVVESTDLSNNQTLLDTVDRFLDDYPELNYVKSFSVKSYSTSNYEIGFTYKFSKDQLIKMKAAVDSKSAQILQDIIQPGMTDLEKERAVHDYIVRHTKYDYDNYLKNTIPDESYTAYGVLVNGVGVCEGYAASMKLLLSLCGVKSIVVTGTADGGAHAWNAVKLGDRYYQVDATWDDPVPDQGDHVSYDYFNISDEQMGKDHSWDKTRYMENF